MNSKISNDDLIKEVLELKEELGRVPTLKEYDKKYHHRGLISRRFGSWNKFLKSIGLEPVQRHYEEGELCSISGCNNKAKVKGLCQRHYDQWLKFRKIYDRTRFDRNEIIEKENYAEIVTYNEKNKVKDRVLIDNENIEKIKDYKVYLDNQGYATVSIRNKKIHLPEFLFGELPEGKHYSYVNKDSRDCRKKNIIIVDSKEIVRRSKLSRRNKTGVKGVFLNKNTGKYNAYIGHEGKSYYLGTFESLEEAKQARQIAEEKLWGKIYTRD